GACTCDTTQGRAPLGPNDSKLAAAVDEELRANNQCGASGVVSCDDLCLCKLEPLAGSALTACQNGTESGADYGYCYIDPGAGIGNPALVSDCPASTRRSLRFVGDGLPANGSITFMACVGENLDDDGSSSTLASGG
ncbi:MAG TPA: hypothetical protein VMI54_24230, partial [Polyangiaceae bacterium]|nr:hypothetical protein [Polyangiaceae bacterium]